MSRENILKQAKQENRIHLTEIESKELLKEVGIPVIDTRLASTVKEAISLSKEIGFPVALKIVSPDVLHKSDIGGVWLDLGNIHQVRNAYREILQSVRESLPQANILGVSIQKMARKMNR